MVAEISSPEALTFLADQRYAATGWRFRSIALSLARVPEWCQDFDTLLDSVDTTDDDDVDRVTFLAAQIARWRAGRIALSDVLKSVPKTIRSEEYQRHELFQIKSTLEKVQKTASAADRKLLARLCKRIDIEW